MTALRDKLKARPRGKPRPSAPVWAGPGGEGPQGGVTQGLLSRYLSCPERYRIKAIEGLRPTEKFESRIEFGNCWHTCEEAHAAGVAWSGPLLVYVRDLCRKFPLQQQEINDWYDKCRTLFPVYVQHWADHPDVTDRTPLLQEQVFDVPYKLPSGHMVRLRGKWDSVDLIGKGEKAGIYVQENKTKSSIDVVAINRQCTFDLQSLFYLLALGHSEEIGSMPYTLKGVRYNVIRRSAHKGSKGKLTAAQSMMKAFEEDRAEGRVGEWFGRWKVEVNPADLTKFRRECLDPVLENLVDDYEWWAYCKASGKWNPFEYGWRPKQFPHHYPRHYRLPFGIYNPVLEGGSSDLDSYLETGSTVGLQRMTNLFPELQEDV